MMRRMAGEDPEVLRLLLEDRDRNYDNYYDDDGRGFSDQDVLVLESAAAGQADEARDEYQEALAAGEIYPAEIEPMQAGYEAGVAQRLAALRQLHPQATALELLGMAL